jgi:beta-xylosidase
MTLKKIFKVFAGKAALAGLFALHISCSKAQEKTTESPAPGNPFITSMYTADPSAHVWADGRLYVYASHDIAPARGCDLMDQYHVFSTDDMVHWKDHGEILRASQVSWGRPEGGFMWAPDCAYKNGTYYFYFPHPSDTKWNSSWKIGVATSKSPASGFTSQGYIKGLEPMIDPCVFVDDDGQAYFYYGGGGTCKGGKLKDNMVEIDGEMKPMEGLKDFHEASWVHKRNGIYYLSYSDNHDVAGKHNQMNYATSKSPLGPWTYQGIYMDPTDSFTNHGSIVQFKGQWYSFYHTSALSHEDWLRSVCVDKLYYNADGTIKKVIPTERIKK